MKTTNFFIKIWYICFFTITSAFLNSCSEGQNMFDIGNTISDDILKKLDSEVSMISSGSFKKLYKVESDNITYKIALNNKNQIVYVETKDKFFETDEGIKIGTSLDSVLKFTESDVQEEKGWAFYIPLNSGWNCAFVVGESMTNKKPTKDSKVKWFFKK